MAQEGFQELLEIQQTRLTVQQGHHVHAEGVLHLGFFVQIVQDHFRHFAALQFDDHAHAGLVRLVADLGNAFQALFPHQFADLGAQVGLVHLVGQLVDDDGLAAAGLLDVLEVALGAHHHPAPAGAVALLHPRRAVDDAGGGEVGSGNDVDEVVDGDQGILQHRQTGIDDLVQVVGRDVGGHAHGDAGGAVHQQVGEPGRQDQGLLLGAVVVGAEVDGFLVDVGQQFVGQLGHADFGVAHGRGVVAVHRAEVALAVHQGIAQGEILSHAHDGVVHRRVAVGVVFTDDVADHAGGLLVGLVPVVVELVHGEQHTPMHGFEAVPGIRQRPANDDAHRVIQVGAAHLLFQADRERLFGELVFHD